MAVLVNRSYLQASPNLATDLARYGSTAQWRGVYYRGEKIGFTVSQTVPTDDGFELQEDGRLQMSLLGATTAATHPHDRARRRRIHPAVVRLLAGSRHRPGRGARSSRTAAASPRRRHDRRRHAHRRAGAGRAAGAHAQPVAAAGRRRARRPARTTSGPSSIRRRCATRRGPRRRRSASSSAPATRSIPAFRVEHGFRRVADHVVDDRHRRGGARGEPAGSDDDPRIGGQARSHGGAGAGSERTCCRPSAVVPVMKQRIDEPRDVRRLRLRLEGADLSQPRSSGRRPDGRRATSSRFAIREGCAPEPADPDIARYLAPEPLIESDAPESSPRRSLRSAASPARAPGRAAHAVRQRPARQKADGQPSVGARGAAHQGRRLQRAHGAVCGDGARGRASRPGLRSVSSTCAARSTTTRGPRCI